MEGRNFPKEAQEYPYATSIVWPCSTTQGFGQQQDIDDSST